MDILAKEVTYDRAILKQRYQELQGRNPKLYARDAAQQLGVSECELLVCEVGDGVTRLLDDAQTILNQLLLLGEVLALTRNDECVHERKGIYNNPSFFNQGQMEMGLFVNSDIDLRLFMGHWKYCFACVEPISKGLRKSIQFFDKSGMAVHKVFLTKNSNEFAYDLLVKKFQHADQQEDIHFVEYAAKNVERADTSIDWPGFREAWKGLQDSHDFLPLLHKFQVGREQSFRNIGSDFALRVDNTATARVLEMVCERHCEIMIFVGNRGCIQIHTGPVESCGQSAGWFNVNDPLFNLHLNTETIASSWITRKPISEGIVTALELFNREGDAIATLFGKRKPGEQELPLWREILAEVANRSAPYAA
jgi:putative hemin transport protein